MKHLILAATALAAIVAATPAAAAITLVATPAAGVDLGTVRVGDKFTINFSISGNQGEQLLGGGQAGVFYYANTLSPSFGSFPNFFGDASTNPIVFTYNFTAIGTGSALVRGFLDGVGSTSGTLSITSPDLTFNVGPALAAVPEPATWGMMLVGFGMIGFGMRRRKSDVRTSVRFA